MHLPTACCMEKIAFIEKKKFKQKKISLERNLQVAVLSNELTLRLIAPSTQHFDRNRNYKKLN